MYDILNGAFDHRTLLVKVKGTMHKMTENDNRASMHGCVSCIVPPSLPPLRATARHLPALSVPGVGHLQILCCPGICQPRGHSRAFDTHAVSYQNITTQRILLCMPLRREVLIRIIALLQRKKLIETTSGTLKCLKRHYSTVRSMKCCILFLPHPGRFDSSRVHTPGNLPFKAEKMLMPGGQPGEGGWWGCSWN